MNGVLTAARVVAGSSPNRRGAGRREKAIETLWASLARPGDGERFEPRSIEGLPEPAQRYLRRAIAPGAPLARAAHLQMHGTIRLRRDAAPLPMTAEQIIAPPRGFIWRARIGRGLVRFRGFDRLADGEGALRWWLWGLVPIVRAAGRDVGRSAAGRLAGEAIFVPSTLLPGRGAEWEAVDDATARFRLRIADETVPVTLHVEPDGRVTRVRFPRWNIDPANGPVGYVPFGADTSDERSFDGYTIPTRIRAGWRLGEADEFVFFDATIDAASLG